MKKRILLFVAVLFSQCNNDPVSPEDSFNIRFENLHHEVESIRGEKFAENIQVETVKNVDVKNLMDSLLYGGKIGEYMMQEAQLYNVFGFVSSVDQYFNDNESHLEHDIGGFYIDGLEKLFIVYNSSPSEIENYIIVHELTHALQDQRHNLTAYSRSAKTLDESVARSYIIEGEANYVMYVFEICNTYDTYYEQVAQSFWDTLFQPYTIKDFRDFLVDNNALEPAYLNLLSTHKYYHGTSIINSGIKSNGWKEIDLWYSNPPVSTEQMIHWGDNVNHNQPCSFTSVYHFTGLPNTSELLDRGTLGELYITVLLYCNDVTNYDIAGSGWAGDQYWVFENKAKDEFHLIWYTVWDTPEDATEFFRAYCNLLENHEKEFIKKELVEDSLYLSEYREKKLCNKVVKKGNDVLIAKSVPISTLETIFIELEQVKNGNEFVSKTVVNTHDELKSHFRVRYSGLKILKKYKEITR